VLISNIHSKVVSSLRALVVLSFITMILIITGTTHVQAVAVEPKAEFKQVESTYSYTVALKSDGTVWTWGKNYLYQLGDGTTNDRLFPAQVEGFPENTEIAEISAGDTFVIARTTDNQVYFWGTFSDYATTHDTYNDQPAVPSYTIPTLVKHGDGTAFGNIVEVEAGGYFAIMRDADGYVWTMGYGSIFNELGQGWVDEVTGEAIYRSPYPGKVVLEDGTPLTGATNIEGGKFHALALKNDGTVYTWGSNSQGQLGNNGATSNPPFAAAIPDFTEVTAIYSGSNAFFSFALKSDGLYGWGQNDSGELGLGDTTNRMQPTLVSSLSGMKPISVAADENHSLVALDNGEVWGAGWNRDYRILDYNLNYNITYFTKNHNLSGISKVAAGGSRSFAFDSSMHAKAWGYNRWNGDNYTYYYGLLGTGDDLALEVQYPAPLLDMGAVDFDPKPVSNVEVELRNSRDLKVTFSHPIASDFHHVHLELYRLEDTVGVDSPVYSDVEVKSLYNNSFYIYSIDPGKYKVVLFTKNNDTGVQSQPTIDDNDGYGYEVIAPQSSIKVKLSTWDHEPVGDDVWAYIGANGGEGSQGDYIEPTIDENGDLVFDNLYSGIYKIYIESMSTYKSEMRSVDLRIPELTENVILKPMEDPSNLYFVDEDEAAGQIGGWISWGYSEGLPVEKYKVYFVNGDGVKTSEEPLITVIPYEEYYYEDEITGVAIPAGTQYLQVYIENEFTETPTSAIAYLWDLTRDHMAVDGYMEDSDPAEGIIQYTLHWNALEDETVVNQYVIGSMGGTFGFNPILYVEPTGASEYSVTLPASETVSAYSEIEPLFLGIIGPDDEYAPFQTIMPIVDNVQSLDSRNPNDVNVELFGPTNLTLYNEESDPNLISGMLSWENQEFTRWNDVYWLDENKEIIRGFARVYSVDNYSATYMRIPDNTPVPEGARYIAVFSRNYGGVSEAFASVDLNPGPSSVSHLRYETDSEYQQVDMETEFRVKFLLSNKLQAGDSIHVQFPAEFQFPAGLFDSNVRLVREVYEGNELPYVVPVSSTIASTGNELLVTTSEDLSAHTALTIDLVSYFDQQTYQTILPVKYPENPGTYQLKVSTTADPLPSEIGIDIAKSSLENFEFFTTSTRPYGEEVDYRIEFTSAAPLYSGDSAIMVTFDAGFEMPDRDLGVEDIRINGEYPMEVYYDNDHMYGPTHYLYPSQNIVADELVTIEILSLRNPDFGVYTITLSQSSVMGAVSKEVLFSEPHVKKVTAGAEAGHYNAGKVIPIMVHFNEPVRVAEGSPELHMNTGGSAVYSDSGMKQVHTFLYTVASDENVEALDILSVTALDGAFEAEDGYSVDMQLPEPGSPDSMAFDKIIVIDTIAPLVEGVPEGTVNSSVLPYFYDDVASAILFKDGLQVEAYDRNDPIQADGTYELQITDLAGNTTTKHFAIDKTAPVVQGIEQDGIYGYSVTPESTESIPTVILSKNNMTVAGYSLGTAIEDEGQYTLTVMDELGNMNSYRFTIDLTAPQIIGVDHNEIYNYDVIPDSSDAQIHVSLTHNGIWIEGFSMGDTLSGEGHYTLTAGDAAGNTTVVSFTIDKTAPEAPTIQLNTEEPAKSTEVTIEYAGTDSVTLKYMLGHSGNYETYSGPLTVNENTVVYAFAVDAAGNASEKTSIEITNIDNEAPIMPTISVNTDEPALSVEVTLEYAGTDSVTLEYKLGEDGRYVTYSGPFTVSENTIVYAVAVDAAGNASEEAIIEISNIDSEYPVGTISINNGAAETNSPNVTLYMSASDNRPGQIMMELSNDGDNWTYSMPFVSEINWTLAEGPEGERTVHMRLIDALGNSRTYVDEIYYYQPSTGIDIVSADKAELTEALILGSNNAADNITASLNLPVTGLHGSSISWHSTREQYISSTGLVNRPLADVGDVTVILTATISSGDASDKVEFTFTVPQIPAAPMGDEPVSIPSNAAIVFNGGVKVDFANVTLPSGSSITAKPVQISEPLPSGMGAVGPVVDFSFQSSQGNTLPAPVQLSLPVGTNANASNTGIFYYNPTSGQWEYQKTQIVDGKAIAVVNHFSIYGVFEAAQTAQVMASPASGAVAEGTKIELSSADAGATIYYTTNGTMPTRDSQQYDPNNKPVVTANGLHIMAVATSSGRIDSQIASFGYSVQSPVLLESIQFSPDVTLAPAFSPVQYHYSASVTDDVYYLNVLPVATSVDATFSSTVNSKPHSVTEAVYLQTGVNEWIVEVSSPGYASSKYEFTIHKLAPAGSAEISAILMDGVSLQEQDDVFRAVLPVTASQLTLDVVLADTTAAVSVTGALYQNHKLIFQQLQYGVNKAQIHVTSAGGEVKLYTVWLYRSLDLNGDGAFDISDAVKLIRQGYDADGNGQFNQKDIIDLLGQMHYHLLYPILGSAAFIE
jgi:alpha-tubulin suppressor-like RCC1 family protein